MLRTDVKIIVKDDTRKLVTEYEPLDPVTIDPAHPEIKRMIKKTMDQFMLNPDAEAPSITIKTTTVIQ